MDEDKDLPLVSNVNDILVEHYQFSWTCNFDRKVLEGQVILRLKAVTESCEKCIKDSDAECTEPAGNRKMTLPTEIDIEESVCGKNISKSKDSDVFKCILDCQDINIHQVSGIQNCTSSISKESNYKDEECLNFYTDKWSLQIWKNEVFCAHNFPTLIKISYNTQPNGLSLLWVKTQDGRNCVYTYGAWINNRSIFPCQEPPMAMATWEASISVDADAVVLMSGDAIPTITQEDNGLKSYYYYTKMILPMSTLALAVGYWKEHVILDLKPLCRIFAPDILFEKAVKQFSNYLPRCLNSAKHYLDRYPFPRIDVLFVPRGFGSLGMASPNIIFLSQSLLTPDESTCARLAHEIAHGWFGLLIGALDWTEEWLSEGFATFMEDIFHTHAMDMASEAENEYCEVKYMLRLKTLRAELEHTDKELQILRPNQGEIPKEDKNGITISYIKNGMNVQKGFMQVHYLKGYFLLSYLCKLVGKDQFIQLLKDYIQNYKGQLVESKEIFNLYFTKFPFARNRIDVETIYTKWLNSSSLPKEILNFTPSPNNLLYNVSISEFNKWMAVNRLYLKTKSSKRRKVSWDEFSMLQSDQLLIVLEKILDEENVSPDLFMALDRVYNLKKRNADVRHRWCELIVKYHLDWGYSQVEQFLQEDLAMGVYLYGELLYSSLTAEEQLARKCFCDLYNEMEPNYQITIQNMIEDIDS
ncbi:aminopeptidase O-like [Centruroides vittatus]|uniref:aminopeptidase O-like n=1 Tax=Centruroides vittatus TaxID=120091 RepID=UPI00350FB760